MGSASWELRKGIRLRLGLAMAALVAVMVAWYAVNSDEPRAPLEIPAGTPQAAGPSHAAKSNATTTAQPITIASAVREEPAALPIGPATPASREKKESDAHDPLHSEGIIRTLQDATSVERAERQDVAPPSSAKPKLPGGAYVQVGVFTHPANAAELKAKLEAQGIPVVIATRVQVGPFKSKKEAEEMREKLKAMGMASIVINQ